jgi:hypothetical protein
MASHHVLKKNIIIASLMGLLFLVALFLAVYTVNIAEQEGTRKCIHGYWHELVNGKWTELLDKKGRIFACLPEAEV